jgi:hypothetical protein
MSALPYQIVDLNSSLRLERKSFTEAGLNERDLDELVINQRELIADVLIENDIIDEGAHLRYIGRQFRDVDVLFAEVDEEEEPRRLVLVEDKLLKNSGSKRQVIGQIVEYAARFQESVRAEDLANHYEEHREWVEQNAELLDRQLERGDFLLVICGDSIHSNVADIVTRLARRADRHPMSGMQLCLDGTEGLASRRPLNGISSKTKFLRRRYQGSAGQPLQRDGRALTSAAHYSVRQFQCCALASLRQEFATCVEPKNGIGTQ